MANTNEKRGSYLARFADGQRVTMTNQTRKEAEDYAAVWAKADGTKVLSVTLLSYNKEN